MKLLFFLIDMNLGGTEKSFLNLLQELPLDTSVDLLLLEHKGELLSELPTNVNVMIIENSDSINKFIQYGPRNFAFEQLQKGKFSLFIKGILQFVFDKIGLGVNPFWAIESLIVPTQKKYDIALAYAGVHNFIANYILKFTIADKRILWIHFDVSKVISNKLFGKKNYKKFDRIFCVAKNTKEVFIQMFRSAKSRVEVFENIVSENVLQKQANLGTTFSDGFTGLKILTLGRLSQEKGQDMIPEVVNRLKMRGFQFRWYLIGDGDLRQEIEKKISLYQIEDYLVLLGLKTNPYAYLRDSDLFVLSSLYEGDPVALKEAKVFNLPIITTNFLSASNLIRNGYNGAIVDISIDGLYDGVCTILENPSQLAKYAENAKLNTLTCVKDSISNLFV